MNLNGHASLAVFALAGLLSGCYGMRPSSGGGQADFSPPRRVNPAAVALLDGYQIEAVATGLTLPTGVAFDEGGRAYVTEAGYSYGEMWRTPRLMRIDSDGHATPVAAGGRNGPWNGVAFHQGAFYVAEGGELEGGRLLRIPRDGPITALVSNLPSMGDHHCNGPAVGADGWIYFSQGTASNSGVVGEDNADFGWLYRRPGFHDIPGRDIKLAGQNFTSPNPLTAQRGDRALTGAFLPFGTASQPGQIIRGRLPCSGSVMRVRPDGSQLELVAWGFRNPFGLAFSPGGQLYVTENGYDDRGSRPVWGTPDVLWEVKPGIWYGWPDFAAGMPLTRKWFKPPGKSQPQFLLAEHPNPPPQPAATFGVHASANSFDFSRNPAFGPIGQAFVPLFGDMAPDVGKVLHPVGFKVVRVDVRAGTIESFAENKGKIVRPASFLENGGLERPVAVRFNPGGDALYVVDFGVMLMSGKGPQPKPGTGVLWRITPR